MIKLTLSMVNAIRREFNSEPKLSAFRRYHMLALKYDVAPETIRRIIKKETWKKSTIKHPPYQYDLFQEYICEACTA